MKRITAAICAVMLAMPAIAAAADAPGCDNVNLSQDVLTKFPKIRQVCQQVKLKGEGIYILFVGEVQEVNAQEMTVLIKDKSGKDAAELKLGYDPTESINVSGKEMKFADMKRGMKLDFWIEHSKWGLYSKPGSSSLKILSKKEL